MAPPPELRTWLPWSELNRSSPLTLEEFRDALRVFPRSAVLIACARFSTIFQYGPNATTVASKEVTEYWIPRLIRPDLVPRALHAARAGRPIFFQGQLRFLAYEAMRISPAHAEDGSQVSDFSLGALLVGAGELLYKKHITDLPDDLDVMANLVADFLPTYEIGSITDPYMLFLRFYIYLKVIIPKLPAKHRTFDVDAEFQQAFGFPLTLYAQFINAFNVHAMNQRSLISVGDVPEAGLDISWFNKTNRTPEQVSEMFDMVCFRVDDLPNTKRVHGYADFDFLKDHPYLRVGDKVYCLDYEYAVAKLESGALWRVAMTMPDEKRLQYYSFWGYVFEGYVDWLFETYADQSKNAIYVEPTFPNEGDPKSICDLIVMCGSTAVLIEAKAATCASSVRYSGDWPDRCFVPVGLLV